MESDVGQTKEHHLIAPRLDNEDVASIAWLAATWFVQ